HTAVTGLACCREAYTLSVSPRRGSRAWADCSPRTRGSLGAFSPSVAIGSHSARPSPPEGLSASRQGNSNAGDDLRSRAGGRHRLARAVVKGAAAITRKEGWWDSLE